MSFLETLLIILGSVIGGLSLIAGVIYFVTRNHKKSVYTSRKRSGATSSGKLKLTTGLRISTRSEVANGEDTLEILLKNRKKEEPNNTRVQTAGIRASTAISESAMNKASPARKRHSTDSKIQKEAEQQPGRAQTISSETAVVQGTQHTAKNSPITTIEDANNKSKSGKMSATIEPASLLKQSESLVDAVKIVPLKESVRFPKSKVYRELESNLKIATTPWEGKSVPFQTNSWDSEQNDHIEPGLEETHDEISEAYIDIRLANSVIWLSNEVGHRSHDLDETYKKLCGKIAERLERIISKLDDKKQS
jgi:hypothetical protein